MNELPKLSDLFVKCVQTTVHFDKELNREVKKFFIKWNCIAEMFWCERHWIAKGNKLYLFNGLYYELHSLERFRALLKEQSTQFVVEAKNLYSTKKAVECFTQLCDHVQKQEPLDCEELVPFRNGYLTPTNNWMPAGDDGIQFSDFLVTRVISNDYMPALNCPDFKRLMSILMPNDRYREEILKFFAYTLLPMKNNLRYHQVWWGGGNNGKTQLAEHWADLLGPLAAKTPLNALLNDSHAMVGLRGKTLNISSEIKGVMLNTISLDRAKSMTTDNVIAARDVYESQLVAEYPNICRHLLIGNDLPYSEYMSDDKAFFSRWFLIFWAYIWADVDWQDYLDERGTTKHVFDKIFANEGTAILAYVVEFIPRIGELEIDWQASQTEWITAGNSAIAFLHNPGIDDTHDTQKRRLFEQYQNWCTTNKRKCLTYQTFFKTLKQRGYTEIRKYSSDGDGGTVSEQYIEALGYSQEKEATMLVGLQCSLNKFGVK